jgi:Uma2 family endonuclease
MAAPHAKRVTPQRHMTLREWAGLPDDVSGELVNGVLEEEEMASEAHELVVMWLGARLLAWLESRGGRVTGSESKYAVRSGKGRKPDLSVFLPGRERPKGHEKLISLAPDIAIEVITPTPRDERRDRIEKAAEYARFGVRWYWLVNPAVRTVELFELDAKGRYAMAGGAGTGRLKVPGCKGLTLDLDALWRYVDSSD